MSKQLKIGQKYKFSKPAGKSQQGEFTCNSIDNEVWRLSLDSLYSVEKNEVDYVADTEDLNDGTVIEI